MITIRTRDYSTEQLRYLAEGLFYAANRVFDNPECQKHADCTTACKSYAICTDIDNTRHYIRKKIEEREALELHRDTQESK